MIDLLSAHINYLAAAPTINYYGWDVVGFWYRQVTEWFFDFSWQVRVAYMILLISVFTIVFVMLFFSRQLRKRSVQEREYRKCRERFFDSFSTILSSPVHLSVVNIERICECSSEDFQDFSGGTFSRLICNLRIRHSHQIYLPNVQLLCELTRVTEYVEDCLKNNRDVEFILQLIDTLSLRISEGRLAIYTSHRDRRVRRLARLCLMLCTDSEPFRYLQEDLNENLPPSYYISLHRLMGWLAATNRQMPPFITMAQRVKDPESAAFMIEEVGYWGSEAERSSVLQFFNSDRVSSRIAAVRVVAQLRDQTKEAELVAGYKAQPEEVQVEILKAITELNTGRQAAFFEKAYITAPSKVLAEQALLCLYMYGPSGRSRFERLRSTPLDRRSRSLLDQIEAMGELEMYRQKSAGVESVLNSDVEDSMSDMAQWIHQRERTADNIPPDEDEEYLPDEEFEEEFEDDDDEALKEELLAERAAGVLGLHEGLFETPAIASGNSENQLETPAGEHDDDESALETSAVEPALVDNEEQTAGLADEDELVEEYIPEDDYEMAEDVDVLTDEAYASNNDGYQEDFPETYQSSYQGDYPDNYQEGGNDYYENYDNYQGYDDGAYAEGYAQGDYAESQDAYAQDGYATDDYEGEDVEYSEGDYAEGQNYEDYTYVDEAAAPSK